MYLEKYATDYQVVDFILNGLALILVVGCGLYAVVAHRRKELMARNLVLLGILCIIVFRMYLGTFIPTDQQAANYFSGDEPLPSASWLTILCYEVHSLSILLCFSGWRSSVPLVSGGIWTFWWVIQSEVRVSLRIVVLCVLVASVIVERNAAGDAAWTIVMCARALCRTGKRRSKKQRPRNSAFLADWPSRQRRWLYE